MLQDPLKVMSIIHKERELYEISSDPQYAEREERECIHFSDLVFFIFLFFSPPAGPLILVGCAETSLGLRRSEEGILMRGS